MQCSLVDLLLRASFGATSKEFQNWKPKKIMPVPHDHQSLSDKFESLLLVARTAANLKH